MDLGLHGRVAVVVGASAGIGEATARVLAREGAQLVLVARRRDRLQGLAGEIRAAGGAPPLVVAADISDPAAGAQVRDATDRQFGRADILVGSAGGSRPASLDAPDEDWESGLRLDFSGHRRMTLALLPLLRQSGQGRIVYLTGANEPMGLNFAGPAKAALALWAKALSREVGPDGITVNCVGPGRVMSEQVRERLYPDPEARALAAATEIPMRRFGEAEDVASLIAFLASARAGFISGATIMADGGTKRFAF